MTGIHHPAYSGALPNYFGAKRRLIMIIFNFLLSSIPKELWHKKTFIDAFVGGGSVSLAAKARGFGQSIAMTGRTDLKSS